MRKNQMLDDAGMDFYSATMRGVIEGTERLIRRMDELAGRVDAISARVGYLGDQLVPLVREHAYARELARCEELAQAGKRLRPDPKRGGKNPRPLTR